MLRASLGYVRARRYARQLEAPPEATTATCEGSRRRRQAQLRARYAGFKQPEDDDNGGGTDMAPSRSIPTRVLNDDDRPGLLVHATPTTTTTVSDSTYAGPPRNLLRAPSIPGEIASSLQPFYLVE